MQLGYRDRWLRFTISCFVATVLLLQGSTLPFMLFDKAIGEYYWPFIDYPMYSKPHNEGDILEVYFTVEVLMADGTVSEVTADDVGLGFFKFYYIGRDISRGGLHYSEIAANRLVALHPNGKSIKEIRVYSSPYIITKNGKGEIPPKLLSKIVM